MVIKARAPVRIDFAGAWTDVALFANSFGGATLNAAINTYVEGRLTAHEGHSFPVGGLEGEHVGLNVTYASAIPAGTGLGTSAALNVVWLALARRELLGNREDRERIAALAYDIEKVLGIIGGKQDQYAAAVGGINLFEFTEDKVGCSPVELPRDQVATLRDHLLLCYSGTARLSSNIHRNVWGAFRAGRKETVDALFRLRSGAYEAREALLKGDLPGLGRILTGQFEASKALDPSTTNESLDRLFEAVGPYAFGGKPCGAGGGGCVIFLCKDAAAKQKAQDIVRREQMTLIDFDFDFKGLELWIEE